MSLEETVLSILKIIELTSGQFPAEGSRLAEDLELELERQECLLFKDSLLAFGSFRRKS